MTDEEIRAAALHYYRGLLPIPEAKIMLIDMSKANLLAGTEDGEDVAKCDDYGACWSFDDGSFVIALNHSLPIAVQVRVLAHEMVHVKQYQENENMPNTGIDYWECPSEIEANGRGEIWFGSLVVNELEFLGEMLVPARFM